MWNREGISDGVAVLAAWEDRVQTSLIVLNSVGGFRTLRHSLTSHDHGEKLDASSEHKNRPGNHHYRLLLRQPSTDAALTQHEHLRTEKPRFKP